MRTFEESQNVGEGGMSRSPPSPTQGDDHKYPGVIDPVVYKVAVGIPNMGATLPEAYHDRMLLAYHLGACEVEQKWMGSNPRWEINWFTVGRILPQFAREQICKAAIENNCTHVFMIDDDMLSPCTILDDLIRHDVDIVAPLAFTRNPPHYPVIYQFIEGYDPVMHNDYFLNNFVKNYPRNSLVQCDAVGFGAVLIKTSVLKSIKQPWFMNTAGSGEDVWFCYLARKVGFKIFMDTSIKLGHLGSPNVITEEYVDQYNKMTLDEKERVYGRFEKYPTFEIVK